MSAPTATTASPATRTAGWYPAEGLLRRGTIVLLPGRGEHPGVYERLGRRLSADAYVVHVLEAAADAPALAEVAQGVAAPLVLAGSDTGALRALAATADPSSVHLDGLLLVGTPLQENDGTSVADWEDELTVRSACPTHRGRLAADPEFDRGALNAPVPAALAAEAADAVSQLSEPGSLPVLLVHGEADAVAPLAPVRALAARLPCSVLVTVADGKHDALNDISHRSVAAAVVQWLERLRAGAELPVIVTVHEQP